MIERVRPGGAAAPGRAARRAGGGFHLPGEAAAPGAAGAAGGIGALWGLQEVLTPRERDDAAQRRGHALLEEMEALRRDLLAGRMDRARLSRLALLAEGDSGDDPALREVVESLSLRARVEAARYSVRNHANST